jgi:hypothetical protein
MGLFWWLPFGTVPEISAKKLDINALRRAYDGA